MTNNNGDQIESSGDDRVRSDFACPKCGEDRIDELVWIDDERVRCTTCGIEYDPNAASH